MTKMTSEKDSQTVDINEKIDMDTIIVQEIGHFGWYQFRTVTIVLIFITLCGMKSEYVLATARIPTRCFIPECENYTDNPEFKPDWISIAIPKTNDDIYDQCQRFSKNGSLFENEINTCSYFDIQKLVPCDKYVYENQNTVVFDFDLGCDEWRRTLIGSIESISYFISIPLTGFISDQWGRKVAFTLNVFCVSLVGLSRYWCTRLICYNILSFLSGIFMAGLYPSGFILVTEVAGPKYRMLIGSLASCSLSLGRSLMPLIAWIVPQWRPLMLILYSPTLVIIFFWYFISNSPKWYYSKNRFEEAERILKDMAHMNKKEISQHVTNNLKQIIEIQRKQKSLEKQKEKSEPWLPMLVFCNRPILIRCIVTPVWWFTFVLVYYSLIYNSVYLAGNPYVSVFAMNAIDILGFGIGIILLKRIGRKPVFSASFFACAASQIAYLFVPKEKYGATLTIYLIGKLLASLLIQIVYLYTAELFPTKYRNRLFAFSSTIGRIGNIVAPLTPAFGDIIPYILNASFCVLSGVLVFVTPETRGTKLPDTMEDACQLSQVNCKKKTNKCNE